MRCNFEHATAIWALNAAVLHGRAVVSRILAPMEQRDSVRQASDDLLEALTETPFQLLRALALFCSRVSIEQQFTP